MNTKEYFSIANNKRIDYLDGHTSNEERQFKYHLLKSQGFNYENRKRMRSWTISHIAQIINTKVIR
jgi:hypothetical protein